MLTILLLLIVFIVKYNNGEILNNFKYKFEQHKLEKQEFNEIKRQARMEAMHDLKPELIKQFKQKELDKLSGKTRQDKLEKLSKAFSLGNSNGQFNSTDKINTMLGIGQSNNMFDMNKVLGNNVASNNVASNNVANKKVASNKNKQAHNHCKQCGATISFKELYCQKCLKVKRTQNKTVKITRLNEEQNRGVGPSNDDLIRMLK